MILLSSYGLCYPIIARKAKKYINPENMKVLLIPFAGFNNEKTAAREINEGLIPFGFSIENIYVLDAEKPNVYNDMHFDMVYVPGGNPFKLLSQAQLCNLNPFVVNLIRNGAIYFGISSGADYAGEDLEYLKLASEDCNIALENYNGLGIVNEKILCHVDQRDFGTLQKIKDCDDRKAIFLRNDELYVIRKD